MNRSRKSTESTNEPINERVIEFPYSKYISNIHTGIEKIVMGANETRIDFLHIATPYHPTGGFLQINPDTYIRAMGSSKKYPLIRTHNIPISPVKFLFKRKGQLHRFTLIFEPLPISTQQMDVIELLENGNYHNFLGIRLKNNLPIEVTTYHPN